jgi:hypothetical protein
MKLLLICETNIIKDIFTLISKKLNIELIIQDIIDTKNTSYDLIIVDQNFIDDKFNSLKQNSKRLGAISSEELPFDKARDFIIPRPFLPTKLETILKDEIEDIKKEESKTAYTRKNYESFEEDTEVTIPVVDYMESLVDDVYNEIEEESDESVITIASLKEGGVLDKNELSKINSLLFSQPNISDEIEENDWKDISDIIDDALDEVREYEFDLSNSEDKYELILTNHKMNELKPLLSKLNQNLIDSLANGEAVDITLKLKKD